jgi:hypothetical protein
MPVTPNIEAESELPITAERKSGTRDSTMTLAAIGMVAYIGCDLLHELVGHGGVCLATGGRPITFSTVHFQCFGGWQPLICAAGILVNLVAGILLWLALPRIRGASVHTRYFLWLCMAHNLSTGWEYIVTSSLTNSGDWANALRGLRPAWHWTAGMVLIGVVFFCLSVRIAAIELRSFIGQGYPARVWRIIFIPYFAAGFVACAAGALNSILSLRLAAGSTFEDWGFLLLPLFLRFQWRSNTPISHPVYVTRNVGWILTAAVVNVIFVAVIGLGVRVGSGG